MRYTASAINYYFSGSGYSTVEGKRYEWKAGDLMLSAPGWAVHNHASYDQPVYELTVQDQPLNIYMESLLWQENLNKPAALLGSEPGFETNRGKAAAMTTGAGYVARHEGVEGRVGGSADRRPLLFVDGDLEDTAANLGALAARARVERAGMVDTTVVGQRHHLDAG